MNTSFANQPMDSQELTVEQSANQLRTYYAQTGSYRSVDIVRVFGDPRQGVGFTAQFSQCHCNGNTK